MDKYKLLSGEELVAKGATKTEAKLPEIGLKEVIANGSWLEQKQIQSALEARKQLVEVEKVDKRGCLSYASWDDKLKLAEVTQAVGGHWRFLGHYRHKKQYLWPEEALYLMEVNCLLLRYNDVIVSLQQSYALLLPDDTSVMQYQVYGSLSRVGYKVFRHGTLNKSTTSDSIETEVIPKVSNDFKEAPTDTESVNNSDENKECEVNSYGESEIADSSEAFKNNEGSPKHRADNKKHGNVNEDCAMLTNEEGLQSGESDNIYEREVTENCKRESDTDNTALNKEDDKTQKSMESDNFTGPDNKDTHENSTSMDQEMCSDNDDIVLLETQSINVISDKDPLTQFNEWKSNMLKSRQDEQNCNVTHDIFVTIPDLSKNKIVTIKAPNKEYIPENVILNNSTYVINVENVQTRNVRSSESRTYSMSDEVNGDHIRRVTSANNFRPPCFPRHHFGPAPFYPNIRHNTIRNFNYWRPRHNMSYFQFNLFFQRPFIPHFLPRHHFFPRPMYPRHHFNYHQNFNPYYDHMNTPHRRYSESAGKRSRSYVRKRHLASIKSLATRLKELVALGNVQTQNIAALQRLINTYNTRYQTSVHLTDQYDISQDPVIETIDLDDVEGPKAKRRKLSNSKSELYDVYVEKIKQMAMKLQQLDSENKSSASHRRAMSSLIKVFNKSFNAEIYISDNFEILDRKKIVLDSSSESDCVIDDSPKEKIGKKVLNPFSVLKTLSTKQTNCSSTSATSNQQIENVDEFHTFQITSREALENIFGQNWLPDKDDFGKPEITSRSFMNPRIIEAKKEEYLFEFLKNKMSKFKNWVQVKIAFQENIDDTNDILQTKAMMEEGIDLKSLVQPEDCKDMTTVLKKLSIVKNNKDTCDECSLSIDYDVFNRDVANFSKNDPPNPHFRIICINDRSPIPSGAEIATLHAKYNDSIVILFAIVGIGTVSYIQMNPSDLPVYTRSNDFR